ncbi:MAG: NADH-quinone oxidoreductase subunit H, partial [Candidatus Poribacteria bacterium]|nr:NADH-quinone oxidoreductase subunit H [Candidatus Poribacteria bacterium]
MENLPLSLVLVSSIIKILIIVHMLLIGVMGMIWAERRVSAWIQDRYGPNRVGPQGLLQPIADGIKFLLKEDLIPEHVDKVVYILAPAIILIPALITCAVVPFGSEIPVSWDGQEYRNPHQIAAIDIGILYMFDHPSLLVYRVVHRHRA